MTELGGGQDGTWRALGKLALSVVIDCHKWKGSDRSCYLVEWCVVAPRAFGVGSLAECAKPWKQLGSWAHPACRSGVSQTQGSSCCRT